MKLNSPFVITISRQLGSGGAYIGQQLAKKLNIFYADREIIDQVAKQFSILGKDLESRDEKIVSFWQSFLQSYAFGSPDAYVPPQIVPTDRILFKAEKEIIEHLARERSSVIIGRCGSYILRNHPSHFSIFLHGDNAFRKKRIQEIYGVSERAAGNMLSRSDKERAIYHSTFTKQDWTDAKQYDISFDTSKIGLDECVDIILNCLK